MRVTIEQVAKTMLKLEKEEIKLKNILRYWFSFEENIDTFSKFIFPEYIKGNIPKFHYDFYKFLTDKESGALASPRGSAKSTISGLVYISWLLVNEYEKYIVYVSQNHAKTVQFIEPISMEFKVNQRLRWLYGDLTPQRTYDDFGRDRQDCIDINGCRVEAVSFEKNLRGFKYGNMRPTLIVCDDIEDDQRVINPVLRKKDEDKLNKVIIPSLDINGRLKMIGTILHLDSLLYKKIRLWNGKIFKIINSKGELLWEERFTHEKLEEIKKNIGSVAFEQEYMNNPVDNETSIINQELVRQAFDYNFNYSYSDMDEIYLGVDFAFSDRITADFSAFVDVGIKNGKKYVLNAVWKKGMSINEQMNYVKHLHSLNNYRVIGFEENSIKGSVKDIRQLNLPIKMFWTGSRDEQNITKITDFKKSKTYSKTNAVNRLSVEFENNMWVIPYNTDKQKEVAERLLSELTSWALDDGKLVELGVHPDASIGLLLVNEILNTPKVVCV